MKNPPKRSLRQIVEAEGANAVAAALGISADYVRKMRRRDRDVSADVLMRCERVYGDSFDSSATLRDYRSPAVESAEASDAA